MVNGIGLRNLHCGRSLSPNASRLALENEVTDSSCECAVNAGQVTLGSIVKLSILAHCEPLPGFRQGCLDLLLFLKRLPYFQHSCAKLSGTRIRLVFCSARCSAAFLLAFNVSAEANSR